jgi:2-oxoglutarate dehydrogenase E2 component (dihydrolipoamide succinyltransferase)
MGESIFEGTITKWLKKVGQNVDRDEPLFEISTDKVDSEIPAPASGVLSEILVPEGQTVQINTVVAVIDGEKAEAGQQAEKPVMAAPPPPAPEERRPAAPPPERAAPKPAPPAPEARPETTLKRPLEQAERESIAAQEGKPAGEPRARETAPQAGGAAPPSRPRPVAPGPSQAREVRTSPLVRRLAREHDIDLSRVRGTGLEGRITKHDIISFLGERGDKEAAAQLAASFGVSEAEAEVSEAASPAAPATEAPRPTPHVAAAPPAAAPPPAGPAPAAGEPPQPHFAGESETVPMTNMRKAIAEHMVLSRRTSAHVNTIFEVDMSAIVRLKEKLGAEFEKREGIKLTYTPFFVKALVETVRDFPALNCSISGDSIVYKKPVNVGIAVALDTGLIVPVVKNAHLKSFTGIALAIHDVAQRARTKKLRPEDVQDGTITITNPGSYGALFGTPIINQPQVAILGVGGVEKRVVVVDDAIAIRPMVFLSLSFDHRVIDGAVADQAMARLKSRLQSFEAIE